MAVSDPIADFLTTIRNGIMAHHDSVEVSSSRIKEAIANVLKEEGYLKSVEKVKGDKGDNLIIGLRYLPSGRNIIRSLDRVSKSSCRVYKKSNEIPVLKNGIGVYVVSTPKGVMSDKQARRSHVGGEVVCSVW